jgi:LemA protein
MSSRAVRIIKTLYGRELKPSWTKRLFTRRKATKALVCRQEQNTLNLYRQKKRFLTVKRILIGGAAFIVLFHIILSIFYYNRLTRKEQDVYKEMAKIDTLLQRRRNISINLARAVSDYAQHEQSLFRHVSEMRAFLEGLNPNQNNGEEETTASSSFVDKILADIGKSSANSLGLDSRLASLVAVAERYPDLKLSENFRQFMATLTETEKDISDMRMHYSEIVNSYTTQIKTFPGNVFAQVYGFKEIPYYQADKKALMFQPIEY